MLRRVRDALRRIAVAVIGTAIVPVAGHAQQAEFYSGKTLTIIVGLNSGGTVDTFVRSFVPYLSKHVPGKPNIIVQNMPGAGGLLATNFLMEKAARDGFSITYQPWDPLAQALGSQGLRARYEQFEYVGGTSDARVNYARRDAVPDGIKTPADIMKAQDIAVGALNSTDISGLVAKLSLEVLGVKHKFITGYRGGQDIFLALQRGEVQLHNTSIGTLRTRSRSFIESGDGIALAYFAAVDKNGKFKPNPHIKEMPAFPDLYRQIHGKAPAGPSWDALNWLVQQFSDVAFAGLAPPGTPAAALAALRKGFEAAMADKDFIAYAIKTNGLPYEFVPVEKGKATFAALAAVSPEILATVRKSIGETPKTAGK
jgi:tripartite-type tricarboxylate transporter receptor subunit TctC